MRSPSKPGSPPLPAFLTAGSDETAEVETAMPLEASLGLGHEGPHHVLEARPAGGYRLYLRFDDGTRGIVDLEPKFDFVGVFAPILDLERFAEVEINRDTGMVEWPGIVSLDPIVLYTWVKQAPGTSALGEDEPDEESGDAPGSERTDDLDDELGGAAEDD